MIREYSKKFVKYIAEDNYSKDEQEQMEYVLNVIYYEIVKIVACIIIFALLGYFTESLIVTTVSCLIKPFIGGYHEENQIRCFIASMLFTAGEILLSMQSTLSFWSNCLLIVLCIFVIYHKAPVINSKMPITLPELIEKNRKKALRNSILFGIVSIVLYNYNTYYSLITWTLVVEVLLMFNKRK